MTRMTLMLAALLTDLASAQAKHYPLESSAGLRLHNVVAESATLHGKRG
jgi:hypothetical protein